MATPTSQKKKRGRPRKSDIKLKKQHLSSQGPPPHPCEKCPDTFDTEENLDMHVMVYH